MLISIPFSAVLFGMVMIYTATLHPDDLVVDNYYKEGMAINQTIARDAEAARLQLTASLRTNSSEGTRFSISHARDSAVVLNLFHVTDSGLDREVVLYPEDDQVYGTDDPTIATLLATPGIWYLQLSGSEFEWRLRSRIITPVSQLEVTP